MTYRLHATQKIGKGTRETFQAFLKPTPMIAWYMFLTPLHKAVPMEDMLICLEKNLSYSMIIMVISISKDAALESLLTHFVGI